MTKTLRCHLYSFAALVLATVVPGLAADESLEGRWLLVEQTYQKGSGGLAVPEDALTLEFFAGAEPRGEVRFGRGPAHSWPAVVSEGEEIPVAIVERLVDHAAGTARAVYRLTPPEGEGWTLQLTEEYSVDEESDLLGSLEVRMLDDGEGRGGYVLTRRLERQR